MLAVILTIHTLIVLALIGVVLLQRSEGGALGMGGGGGGFMTGRGAATALTRTTSVLAALFFATSMALAIFADRGVSDERLIEQLTNQGDRPAAPGAPAAGATTDDLLRSLGADPAPTADAAPAGVLDSILEDVGAETGADPASDQPAPEEPTPPSQPNR